MKIKIINIYVKKKVSWIFLCPKKSKLKINENTFIE